MSSGAFPLTDASGIAVATVAVAASGVAALEPAADYRLASRRN